jgi:hypothetical protein
LAHRVISLPCGIWSLSGPSEHRPGRANQASIYERAPRPRGYAAASIRRDARRRRPRRCGIYGFIANIYFYDIDTPLKEFVVSHDGLVQHCRTIHAAVSA